MNYTLNHSKATIIKPFVYRSLNTTQFNNLFLFVLFSLCAANQLMHPKSNK